MASSLLLSQSRIKLISEIFCWVNISNILDHLTHIASETYPKIHWRSEDNGHHHLRHSAKYPWNGSNILFRDGIIISMGCQMVSTRVGMAAVSQFLWMAHNCWERNVRAHTPGIHVVALSLLRSFNDDLRTCLALFRIFHFNIWFDFCVLWLDPSF